VPALAVPVHGGGHAVAVLGERADRPHVVVGRRADRPQLDVLARCRHPLPAHTVPALYYRLVRVAGRVEADRPRLAAGQCGDPGKHRLARVPGQCGGRYFGPGASVPVLEHLALAMGVGQHPHVAGGTGGHVGERVKVLAWQRHLRPAAAVPVLGVPDQSRIVGQPFPDRPHVAPTRRGDPGEAHRDRRVPDVAPVVCGSGCARSGPNHRGRDDAQQAGRYLREQCHTADTHRRGAALRGPARRARTARRRHWACTAIQVISGADGSGWLTEERSYCAINLGQPAALAAYRSGAVSDTSLDAEEVRQAPHDPITGRRIDTGKLSNRHPADSSALTPTAQPGSPRPAYCTTSSLPPPRRIPRWC
jgi:hypothetical protein